MSNKNKWVDFKEIKEQVTMQMLLDRYDIQLKKNGKNHIGCCPIHKGTNKKQFSVNLQKNIWNCFGDCKVGGNVLDFAAMMETGNKEAASIRKAALSLKNLFLIDKPSKQDEEEQNSDEPSDETEAEDENDHKAENRTNKPLSFELKHLEQDHEWFSARDISPETVAHFGLGLQKTGKFIAGRIAIPIHDHLGQLVAYCGRAINNSQVKKEGKYKLPPNFIKSDVVYNLHHLPKDIETLVLVESYISVWKLHQIGISNSVALMGSQLSETQEMLIKEFMGSQKRVICLFDADEAGKKCTLDCVNRLSASVYVKAVDIAPYAPKPHLLASEQIHACQLFSN